MGRIKSIAAAACATLLIGAATVAAQPADRSTFVTFSGPVSIPGKTLPAGTYTFKLADSPSDRHIVQIYDKDQTQLFATVLAVPAERPQPDGEPVITFRETPSNVPPALRYWYYAGETAGNEFVYPRSQAMTIAHNSGEGVMSMDTESTDVSKWSGTPSRVTANAEPQSASTASTTTTPTASTTSTSTTTSSTTAEPTTAPAAQPMTPPTTQPTTTSAQPTTTAPTEPTTQPTTSAPTTTAPRSATQEPAASTAPSNPDRTVGTSGRSDRSELPHTAGELPTVGLIALFAFAGAFALRAARKAAV
jgi:hypothetical protein